MEESKILDPNLIDTGDSGKTTNPHGDAGSSGITQAVAQSQCGNCVNQDWDSEVLNHVLVHVLNKDMVNADATEDFTVFMIDNGVDDAHLLLTVLEDNFKSMGLDIDFKTFRSL